MMQSKNRLFIGLILAAFTGALQAETPEPVAQTLRTHTDLLSAGLGLDGLRSVTAPLLPSPVTADALRVRALWTNWRGIADLSAGGGFGTLYGSLKPVPGREYSALFRLKGAKQLHRIMVQVPDDFDIAKRCLLVSASSGSRGIYGAIALAGAWGLNHGCAVAYTDKGAGTDFLVPGAAQQGVAVSGLPATPDQPREFSFPPGFASIAVKHAHSADHPEADWGRYVQQAADYGLSVLNGQFPAAGRFTHATTRTLAVGVSNGGGTVLRAAELPGNWLDGVVAISPNIYSPGSRPLYDYSTEAALLMPCALNAAAFDAVAYARPGGLKSTAGALRCASLAASGLLTVGEGQALAEQAWKKLLDSGWTQQALVAGSVSTAFDLWRAVAVTYASSYLRAGPDSMPCGYRFDLLDAVGKPRALLAGEQAAWWSDGSGIPPSNGVGILDAKANGKDPAYAGLSCLRALWQAQTAEAKTLQRSVQQTRTKLPQSGVPVLVIHGLSDGLVPAAFTSEPYVQFAQSRRSSLRYWQVENAQHFDAFLGQPVLAVQYVPMMPYAYKGLDAMWAHISQGAPLPTDRVFKTIPRKASGAGLEPLSAANLDF
jgi:hydroxybutyrate-dimer hydrolase